MTFLVSHGLLDPGLSGKKILVGPVDPCLDLRQKKNGGQKTVEKHVAPFSGAMGLC